MEGKPNHTLTAATLDEMQAAANTLLELFPEGGHFAVYGEMGAGKTTFIQCVCKALRLQFAGSPTFSLVNEYTLADERMLYHFDLYRLEKESEALDFGIEDYLCSGHYCFIEWPEKASGLMPEDAVRITVTVNNQERTITLSV